MNNVAFGILLAAGNSVRMGYNKLLMSIADQTPLMLSAEAMLESGLDRLFITVGQETRSFVDMLIKKFPEKDITPVPGGSTRAMSVLYALRMCSNCNVVVIHDAARCLVTSEIIKESIRLAKLHGSAIAMTQARDTIRSTATHKSINREEHVLIQTPQTFLYNDIIAAYEAAYVSNDVIQDQDDCAIYARFGFTPYYFEAGILNQKLTFPGDIPFFTAALNARKETII